MTRSGLVCADRVVSVVWAGGYVRLSSVGLIWVVTWCTMSLLKPVHKTAMLIPNGQLLTQTFHHNGNLIPEQNPLFLLATDESLTYPPVHNCTYHTIRTTQCWPSHVGTLRNYLRSTHQYLPHDLHKPVPIRPHWREVAVPTCEYFVN